MKESRYNMFIEQPGLVVCYNSFTDHLVAVSKNVYHRFAEHNFDDFFLQYPDHYNKFVDLGFLIPDDKDELSELRYAHKLAVTDSSTFQLIINPTLDCNLKCWYCFETHVHGSKMTPETQEKVIKLIENQVTRTDLKIVNISFFGGEPLMYFDKVVYPLCSRIGEICRQNGKRFMTSFVTNASLIQEKMIDKLKEISPSFQITIDGNREKHNKVKIGKNNLSPTYDRVLHALDLLTHQVCTPEKGNRIVLRINYDNDTLKDIDTIIHDLEPIDKRKIVVHLERVWQTIQGDTDDSQKDLLIDAFRKLVHAGFRVNHGIFFRKNYACPVEKFDYMTINYNGNLYKCSGRDMTEENADGKLTENGTIEWKPNVLAKRLGRTTFENKMCLACKLLPCCMGPCSQKCLENDWKNLERVCFLKNSDLSLEEHLLLRCEMEYLQEKAKETLQPA